MADEVESRGSIGYAKIKEMSNSRYTEACKTIYRTLPMPLTSEKHNRNSRGVHVIKACCWELAGVTRDRGSILAKLEGVTCDQGWLLGTCGVGTRGGDRGLRLAVGRN